MIADDETDMTVSPEAFEIFHHTIDARLQHGRLAVADSTAVNPDARAALIRIARRRRVPTSLVAFNIPEEVCFMWDARRTRHVGQDVIHRQWVALQRALGEIGQEGHQQVVVLGEADLDQVLVEFKPLRATGATKPT